MIAESEMPGRRSKSSRRWRLLVLATVVFFIAAGIYFVLVPIQQSKQLEQKLIERFDWANEYIPPANGLITPERAEKFIRVREAVQTNCAIFQGILDSVMKLEEMESNQDMSAAEKASEGIESLQSMFSAAPNFLEFMDARNNSLLIEEMGLGEYIYIYLAAYGPQLAGEGDSRYADQEEAYISSRARDEYVQILGNQQTALEATGSGASTRALVTTLQAEISALKDGTHTSPWPSGPPAMTGNSLAPYREQLDNLYCQGIVEIELMQKNRGLNFRD
jgi:hypothetical protein